MGGINSTERTGPYQIRKITIMNPIRNIVMNLEPLPSDTYFSSRIRIKIGLFHREDDGGRKGGGKGIEIFFLAHLFVSVEGKLTRGIVLFDLSIFSSNNFYFFVSSFCRPVTFICFCLRPFSFSRGSALLWGNASARQHAISRQRSVISDIG